MMNERQIIHKIELLVDEAFVLNDDFEIKVARRLVKDTKFMHELVTRLIIEADTSKTISNIAQNKHTKVIFERYVHNLLSINDYLEKFTHYTPKTQIGYRMYIKDMITYANDLNIIK